MRGTAAYSACTVDATLLMDFVIDLVRHLFSSPALQRPMSQLKVTRRNFATTYQSWDF